MNTFGKNIKCSVFGESHGEYIGITIDGLPTNLTLDLDLIKRNLQKRLGNELISTSRREPEDFKIISGYFENNERYFYRTCACFKYNLCCFSFYFMHFKHSIIIYYVCSVKDNFPLMFIQISICALTVNVLSTLSLRTQVK